MAKSKNQKQEILRDLIDKLSRAKSVIFASFSGLKVADNEELRHRLQDAAGEYYVAKKTLLNMALKDQAGSDFNARATNGQLAAVFGYEDEVAPAKILQEFMKDHGEQIVFVSGWLEGRALNAQEVKVLAAVPSRAELYAKLVGSINAPVAGFVNALAGNLRGLLGVLNAIQEKKS